MDEKIGTVTHYFPRIGVAAIRLTERGERGSQVALKVEERARKNDQVFRVREE